MEDVIKKYEGHIVDQKTQQQLNQPVKDDTGFNDGHEDFLKILIDKIESKEINPLDIKTLFNKPVYDNLSEEDQEKTDLNALNIMGIIKQIEKLWGVDQTATFQVQNLVETVFQMKSKYEERHGDVYII